MDYRGRLSNKQMERSLISNQWINNTVMTTEALIMLDLVATVVRNIGAKERGKLKVCANCKVMCDVLTLDIIKASQFALDGGSIISKIVQLERESEVDFEHMHVKTSNDNEELGCD